MSALLSSIRILVWSYLGITGGYAHRAANAIRRCARGHIGAVLAAWFSQIAGRLVGGYTGDVLGAVEQLFEVSFLIAIAAVMQA